MFGQGRAGVSGRLGGIVLGLTLAGAASWTCAAESPNRREVADRIGAARADVVAMSEVSADRGRTSVESVSTGVADGLTWLEDNQNGDGSWGSLFELIVSSTVLETLTTEDPCLGAVDAGATWLADQDAANYEFLARQILGLASTPAFQNETADLTAELLAVRNPVEPDNSLPNWPEGGWGIDGGFETDCLTTALALLALDRAGFNGGFQVTNVALAPGATNIHEWEIPSDAVKVRFLITVAGSQIRLCMTEGAPPPFCSSFFPLLGGPFLITLPDDGLPFTPGTNFVVIESTGPAATYTMTASYETPIFDTRSLAEPLDYLAQSQNVDGGWGLQRGQDTEFYTALHVLLALLRYGQYDLDTEIAEGLAYTKVQQLADGSFGFGGPGIPYVTALAALNLIRSESSPFSLETEDAVTALTAQQELDGSWNQQAYDTALAVLALREHGEPPTANAGPDQTVPDPDADCSEPVTLSGSGTAINGTIVGYQWREDCAAIASGSNPVVAFDAGEHVVALTVTDSNGQTGTDLVTITVEDAGTDLDNDGFSLCGGDCNDDDTSLWLTPGEVVNLLFTSQTALEWNEPLEPGGFFPDYDVLRSGDPADFVNATVCVESDDSSDTAAVDLDTPAEGTAFHYLIRAENGCPVGVGPLGTDSAGTPRAGRSCP